MLVTAAASRPCTPAGTVDLNFRDAAMGDTSFAGGKEIRWVNVAQSADGRGIDMTVTERTSSSSCPGELNGRRPCSGGIEGGFGWIEWQCRKNLDSLSFRLEYSDNHEPASVPAFDMSFSGISWYEAVFVRHDMYDYVALDPNTLLQTPSTAS